jgi:hypothetical protein
MRLIASWEYRLETMAKLIVHRFLESGRRRGARSPICRAGCRNRLAGKRPGSSQLSKEYSTSVLVIRIPRGTAKATSGVALAMLIASTIGIAACAGEHSERHSTAATKHAAISPSAAAPLTAAAPSGSLIGEIDRELAAMRVTRYQHTTRVDEASGTFMYDCSGLLDYALGRALPADAGVLPTTTSTRPLAGDIERYLRQGLTGPIDGWHALARVDELRPGDVVAWLATEDSKTGDTGHVMVVLAMPVANPARPNEWLVQVADSTLNPHARDSRKPGDTGLGTGTIGLATDGNGAPVAFYWQGGISDRAKTTEISLGRPA